MRICLVSSSFYPAISYGGPISSTWDLSRSIGDKGVEVYVSTTNANGKGRLKDVDTKSHVKLSENVWVRYYHEQIINYFSLSFCFNIWRDIKKADIIYIQYLFNYTVVVSLVYSFLLQKKIILCPRGSFSSFTLARRRLIKKLWIFMFIKPFKNRITWQCSSYLERNDVRSCFPDADVVIIPDSIDFNNFQLSSKRCSKEMLLKEYTGRDFEKVTDIIFSMGRLHKIKGFHILIDAFSLFLKDYPYAKLIIAGEDDGFKKDLLEKISQLNLKESVFLIGLINHSQKTRLFANSTIFSLCSSFESFGIVVAESLACGCPVVVSNRTPWRDVEQNKCGIFVENNKEDIYLAFTQIKEKDIKSEDCKKYVKDNFDLSIISRMFLTYIKNK